MPKPSPNLERLKRLSEICLALPEAIREDQGDHASFSVRKKKFAYFLANHHGDGIVAICVRTAPGQNQVLAESEPQRYYLPAYIGPRGWVGIRLDVDPIDWEEITDYVKESYRNAAPNRLLERLG